VRRVPLELQSARNECGLACLAMVVGFYDRHTGLRELRRRYSGYSHGMTLKTISELAQDLGFLCRGVRAEPTDLAGLRVPAILHWNMDHFVVLVQVRRKGCVLHDPALGKVFRSWAEIDDSFTGVALELWPGDAFVPAAAVAPSFRLRDLWPMVSGSRDRLVWVLLLSVVLQAMVLSAPWHVQWTVDEALASGDVHLIGVLCVGFGLLLVCRLLTYWIRGLLVVHLGHMLSFQLACRLLGHLLHLPLGWFEQRHVGDIASRFASLQPIRDLLTQGAAAIVVDVLMVVLSLLLMFVYSPPVAGLVLAVHAIFLCFQFAFVPMLKRLGLGVVVAQAAEQSHLLESVRAIHNVKLYTHETERLHQWQRLHAHTLDLSMSLQRTQLGIGTLAMLVAGVELIILVYLISHRVLAGGFTLGMLFAFLSYRGHFAERLQGLVDQLVQLRTLSVHLQRLGEIWGEAPEVIAPAHASLAGIGQAAARGAPLSLSMNNVSFRHTDANQWVLRSLNLHVAPGEFLAVIGVSGGGKTTLLQILMGLITPSEGSIEWGHATLQPDAAIALRERSGCVLQTDSFFSGSVLENIVLFSAPDLARVRQCLSVVGMLETLERMPMGYRTQIGDIGSGLSSGQMQRLLLARALYRNPDYLFLDEGTANLDAASASGIREVLQQLRCTRVVVTHDLAFAACADRTLMLEGGVLKEVTVAASAQTTS